MTEKISRYQALKLELDIVENELKNHKRMPNNIYAHLKKKQEMLKQAIDKCPLIYEIWLDGDTGSMSMHQPPDTLKERYLNRDRAYARLNELNDDCNYGRPYYMKISELDG